MKLINIANADIPEDITNSYYINTPKCKVVGIVTDIKSEKRYDCGSVIYFKVNGGKDYLVRTTKRTDSKCESDFGGYTYGLNEKLPNIGDKVEFLIDKDQHYIMSKNGKLEYGTGKIDRCENNILENYIFHDKVNSNNIIYSIILLIILLPIISIYIYKKIKKI